MSAAPWALGPPAGWRSSAAGAPVSCVEGSQEELTTMPYASGRVYHDADAHIMEPADWLVTHADAAFRDRMPRFRIGGIGEGGDKVDWVAHTCPLHLDDDYRADESQITLRKNYFAVGAFERHHRSQALDQLGFASQLVFSTFSAAE